MVRNLLKAPGGSIVSKPLDAPDRSGPSKMWLKSKNPLSAPGARGRVGQQKAATGVKR